MKLVLGVVNERRVLARHCNEEEEFGEKRLSANAKETS